jgi:hypothetical protein
MKWLRSSVEGAGLARFGLGWVVFLLAAVSVLSGLWAFGITKVFALGVCLGLGAFGFGLELVNSRAKARRRELASLWPEVVDSLQSAAASGVGFAEGFAELAQRGPLALRVHFAGFTHRIDSGWPIELALDWLKHELGEIHADRLLELLQVVAAAGGEVIKSRCATKADSCEKTSRSGVNLNQSKDGSAERRKWRWQHRGLWWPCSQQGLRMLQFTIPRTVPQFWALVLWFLFSHTDSFTCWGLCLKRRECSHECRTVAWAAFFGRALAFSWQPATGSSAGPD